MRKQYIRKGIWKIRWQKRKQKGGLFSVIAAQVGSQLVSGLVNKITAGTQKRKRKTKFRKKNNSSTVLSIKNTTKK